MKIALFYPVNMYAGWYACGGYLSALGRMRHEVVNCGLPGNQVKWVDELRKSLPTIEQLNTCDVVLSAYHEYVQPWLKQIYGFEAWSKLRVPVIGRFDESMDRFDLKLEHRMTELLNWLDYWSFPTIQDARTYHGEWILYGSDTRMFHPRPGGLTASGEDRRYNLAFIGSMYPLRVQYLEKLGPHVRSDLTFMCGPVAVQDLGGINLTESTQLLAREYRRIKVFFCLPGMARMILAKVFDVMACGTFVMVPKLYGSAKDNLDIFEDGQHVVYYDVGQMVKNAEQIHYWVDHDDERERIANAGCDRIFESFTIERMLTRILEPANLGKRPIHKFEEVFE